jgi:hypothetical protein
MNEIHFLLPNNHFSCTEPQVRTRRNPPGKEMKTVAAVARAGAADAPRNMKTYGVCRLPANKDVGD